MPCISLDEGLHQFIDVLCFRSFLLAAMTSLLKSEAAFKERAIECGLTEAECNALVSRGVTTLSAVAYAVSTPGVNPTEAALRGLLSQDNPDAVTIGSLAAIRRLVFESQTLAIVEVKLAIEGSDGDKRSELAPAERASRIAAQKAKLAGYDLSGTMEVAHSCYTYVGTMIDGDSPFYLEPHKFITRAQEIAHERPGKEIILDASKLTVRDKTTYHRMQIQNELQLSQAFTRRSLACDLMGVVTFRVQENWRKFLMDRLAESPPPNFRRITMEQVLRADRQAGLWTCPLLFCGLESLPKNAFVLLQQYFEHFSFMPCQLACSCMGADQSASLASLDQAMQRDASRFRFWSPARGPCLDFLEGPRC